MDLRFTKMHGLGNDFMVVQSGGQAPPEPAAVRRLADRHTGVGFDQLLWLDDARQPDAAVFYRIFNADGSEAEQCGNGARCVARLVGDATNQQALLLEHPGGLAQAHLLPGGDVRLEMGEPDFRPEAIPFIAAEAADSYTLDVGGDAIELGVVSMGNPHAVLLVDAVDAAPVAGLGAQLERHERFPNRANISFLEVISSGRVRLRVFERGVGETLACGTAACAAVAVGRRAGRLDTDVEVALPGGEVTVSWEGAGKSLWLTGEAVTVFEGTVHS
ncbi:MAG: diaminopimelate epimerase [Gammaproteobacteria bacterium]|nr:diaminopimelate epimerase [Gammaproteobacteria bacterium]